MIDAPVAAVQAALLDRIGDVVVRKARPLWQRPEVDHASANGVEAVGRNHVVREAVSDGRAAGGIGARGQWIENTIRRDSATKIAGANLRHRRRLQLRIAEDFTI